MDRVIEVKVGGNYLSKDSKNAGVRGEANVAYLRITFDEGWDEYTKKVTFWDSRGGNPVVRTLTIDLLENISKSKRIYLVPIPAEPMAEAGMLTYVIDGYIDGKRQRSISDQLEVKDAPIADNAGEPTDPTPTQAEQLQGQIEQIIDTIQNASVSADNAKESEENAKASEEAAEKAANTAVESEKNTLKALEKVTELAEATEKAKDESVLAKEGLKTAEANAKKDAADAKNSADNAAKSEENAKESEEAAAENKIATEQLTNRAETAAENAEESEVKSSASQKSAEQALADLLRMINSGDIVLATDGKLPLSAIPATATQEIYVVESEDELTSLVAQRGDLAELVEEIDGERTITKTWQCLGDASVRENWVVWGTSYAVQSGNATTADNAVNANMINNHRLVEMTEEDFASAVKDADTYYLVY